MNDKSHQRAITEGERAFLEKLLRDAPSRWKLGVGNAVVLWAVSMLIFLIAWSGISWIARIAFAVSIGWRTSVGLWMLLAGGVACLVFAVHSTMRWLRTSPDYRLLARLDLSDGIVFEERLIFTEARRFQEPEHGGLIYFLRTTDDRVFVLYDHESQDLGVEGKDPLSSSLQPKSELLLIRAPNTRLVITKTFAGDDLPTTHVCEMVVPPTEWPETEEFCSIPWSELEHRYARAA